MTSFTNIFAPISSLFEFARTRGLIRRLYDSLLRIRESYNTYDVLYDSLLRTRESYKTYDVLYDSLLRTRESYNTYNCTTPYFAPYLDTGYGVNDVLVEPCHVISLF